MPHNKNKLVVFGDSWAQGSELPVGHPTFGKILSYQLNLADFRNYSEPASSITHLLIQFKNFLTEIASYNEQPNEYMAIFFLTDQNRGMTSWQNQWVFQTALEGAGNIDRAICNKINDVYWKYIHSPELTDLVTNTSIIALQSMCRQYNVDDLYIAGWQSFSFWPEVDIDKIYKAGKVNCGDLLDIKLQRPRDDVNKNNPNLAPGGHPNQQGHRLIAEALFQWINSA